MISTAEMSATCTRMVTELKSKGRWEEAATLAMDHGNDVEEAVAALVEGGCWAEAERVATTRGREDLMQTHYYPRIREAASHAQATTISSRENLTNRLVRFRAVVRARQIKMECGPSETGWGNERDFEDSDLYSDTTSVATTGTGSQRSSSNPASLKTRVTQRSKSGKNRRKNEKKKYSTREGSAFEDIGIAADVHHIISTAYKATGLK